MPKEDAIKLELRYKEGDRFGYKDEKVHKLSSYHKIKRVDAFLQGSDENGNIAVDPIWIDTEGKEVPEYCLYDPVPDRFPEYVSVEGKHLVDLQKLLPNCHHEFIIIESKEESQIENITASLQTILEKVEAKIQTLNKQMEEKVNFNQKCNVHVGGGLLVTFNDLKLKEDMCTDELQVELNNGWRIIAICVQPNQRRPDYVLGRYNPEFDTLTEVNSKR